MTSKEILQHIKNAPSFKGGDSRYMSTLNSAFLYDQDIDTIEKDLEVLEILKKYINTVNNGFTLCGNYYDEKDFKKEDFIKIMEWLKND